MAKMGVAVVLGRAIAGLSPTFVSALSAVTYFAMAAVFFWKRPIAEERRLGPFPPGWRAAPIAFAAIFLPEWGDPGQLTAALFVAEGRPPLAIWAAATLAMATKGALSVVLGTALRRWVPARTLRPVTVCLALAMGLVVALRIEL